MYEKALIPERIKISEHLTSEWDGIFHFFFLKKLYFGNILYLQKSYKNGSVISNCIRFTYIHQLWTFDHIFALALCVYPYRSKVYLYAGALFFFFFFLVELLETKLQTSWSFISKSLSLYFLRTRPFSYKHGTVTKFRKLNIVLLAISSILPVVHLHHIFSPVQDPVWDRVLHLIVICIYSF